MTDTITIQIPTWLFFVFAGLVVVHGFLNAYVIYLKRKIAELEHQP